ncbi:putative pumilio 7 [Hirschfeldia incana]|nr:putative pumilio 7 [Hirschfeldia incana]
MGDFREASSPSSPLRTPSHSTYFNGDFSPSNSRFSFNSSSDFSLSSSFSNGFYSSDDSSASPPFNGLIPNYNHSSPPLTYHHHEKNVNGDDLGLCNDLYSMKIKEDVEEEDPLGSILETNHTGSSLDLLCFSHYEPKNNGGFFHKQKESCDTWFNNDKRDLFGHQTQDSIASSRHVGWPSYSTSNNPYNGQEMLGLGLNLGGRDHSAYYSTPTTTSDMLPLFCQGAQASKVSEPFTSDESFFMDHQRAGVTRGLMSDHGNNNTTEICHTSLPNVCDIQGYVYLMAKDQHGCRFLQRIFDEGTPIDAMIIFNEVIAHVVELMMDPFGNYLMQKLLDVCTEEQRTQIVLVATAEPGQLIRISLNAYGTRVVQRLVETIRTGKQVSMVKSALRPGFLDLIKDLNGNHVIQRCLQCLGTEDNKFIFDAATKFCTEIATHRHGCCVLQKCIAYSMRQQREKLIAEISRNSLLLAQDPFGNYAVQFVIELRIPSAVAMMLAQLKGHYIQLSMQKFSSHMVERCLMHCPESRPQIVRELVSVPHFDHLLQDPYANFVIQAALAATKGPLHASLVEVIRPHSILRNNPYCKRIFSRNLLKK